MPRAKVIALPTPDPTTSVVVSMTTIPPVVQTRLVKIHEQSIELQRTQHRLAQEANQVAEALLALAKEENKLWDSVMDPLLERARDWYKSETIGTCKVCGRPTPWLHGRIFKCRNNVHRKGHKARDTALQPVVVTTSRRRSEVSDRVWAILADEEVE